MPSRFYSQKDINTIDKFNKELVGDLYTEKDGVITPNMTQYPTDPNDK